MNDVNSLTHTSWNCKYHIVFAPKYRRKVFYGQKRREIGEILRTLCNWKKVKIVEAEVCPDHIHMLVEIPPKYSVSSFMGYLKGKSSLMLYEKFPELKFKYRNREFWCRGYYVDTAGKNDKKIGNSSGCTKDSYCPSQKLSVRLQVCFNLLHKVLQCNTLPRATVEHLVLHPPEESLTG